MKTISNFCKRSVLEGIAEVINDRRIQVYADEAHETGEISLKVNWSAIGPVDPSEAADFARRLQMAADIASTHPLNGLVTVY